MSNPFDLLNAINYTKEDLIREPDREKEYKPFLTNRSLSYHSDAIFEANMMNRYPEIDSVMQFDFYINILAKRKRFAKWSKSTINEDLEAVMEYFGYNRTKAEEALTILSKENIAMIRAKCNKGGLANERRSKRSSGDQT